MRLETTRKTHLALQALRVLDTTQAPIKGKDLAVLIEFDALIDDRET